MCLSIPGEVTAIRREAGVRMGDVRFAGVVREVCLECLGEVAIGDYVLVHVGFAISRIDREEAERAYRELDVAQVESELAADPAGSEPGP
ncbi:MAG TPA: HypC/HybG/HupF family hydrogenase formation chaperone [Anaeromyxobacteraceae bacterium]|nr:HypC/HybG/HupF family hydrogenase formation chaperone [Anaeromyxobacteraceae bacterium]